MIYFEFFSLVLTVDNNFMDDKELGYTNHFIHYNNVLSERHSH